MNCSAIPLPTTENEALVDLESQLLGWNAYINNTISIIEELKAQRDAIITRTTQRYEVDVAPFQQEYDVLMAYEEYIKSQTFLRKAEVTSCANIASNGFRLKLDEFEDIGGEKVLEIKNILTRMNMPENSVDKVINKLLSGLGSGEISQDDLVKLIKSYNGESGLLEEVDIDTILKAVGDIKEIYYERNMAFTELNVLGAAVSSCLGDLFVSYYENISQVTESLKRISKHIKLLKLELEKDVCVTNTIYSNNIDRYENDLNDSLVVVNGIKDRINKLKLQNI